MTSYTESELYVPAMIIMASRLDGLISTSSLIEELESAMKPTGHDAEILNNRGDTHFSQLVRNIKSHKDSPSNPIHDGLIQDTARNEMRLSDLGYKYLNSLGHDFHRL